MIIPGKYGTDVDFAVVAGDTVLLIDAKYFSQKGGFFWSLGGRSLFKGLSRYRSSTSGKVVELSRNMSMARDVFSRKLPHHSVMPVVIFVTDHGVKGARIPCVRWVRFPGGVRSYNFVSAKRLFSGLSSRKAKHGDLHRQAVAVLKKCVQ